jgi:D-3-phosphoglycerate dehydrogenase
MSTYEILTLNPIAGIGLRRFPEARYRVGNAVERPDAILVRSRDMHAMTIPPTVLAISRAGRRHQQHPDSRDVHARRAGIQRARRERERG